VLADSLFELLLIDRLNLGAVHVYPLDLKAGVRQSRGEAKTELAEPDHGYPSRPPVWQLTRTRALVEAITVASVRETDSASGPIQNQ
jgi:hypothetical protein